MEASKTATVRTENENERQKGLLSEAEKARKSALNDVASLTEPEAAASTRKAELFSSASAASSQMATATAELHQARDTITMQSERLAEVPLLRSFIKSLKDNVSFYEASEEELQS